MDGDGEVCGWAVWDVALREDEIEALAAGTPAVEIRPLNYLGGE